MHELSTTPFESLLFWACWKTACARLYRNIYSIYPISCVSIALLCAILFHFGLFWLISLILSYFVVFWQSLVPQKGSHRVHIRMLRLGVVSLRLTTCNFGKPRPQNRSEMNEHATAMCSFCFLITFAVFRTCRKYFHGMANKCIMLDMSVKNLPHLLISHHI